MEHNAAALQTMYRQTFATELANGTGIVSSMSFQQGRSLFPRTNLTLKDSEQIDNPQRV